jgi:hypothetical protein
MHNPLFAGCWQYPPLYLVPITTPLLFLSLALLAPNCSRGSRHTIAERLPALDLDALVERVRSIDWAGVPKARGGSGLTFGWRI